MLEVPNEKVALNREAINEAILLLTQAYTNPNPQKVEKAIEILNKSILLKREIELIRGDNVRVEEKENFYYFGIPWFDEWTGGVRKKEVVLIAGVPYAGKSHVLSYCGANGLLEGANVLHIVGEDLIADIQGMYVAVTGAGNAALQNLWFLDMLDATFGIREVEAGIEASKKADKIPDIVVLDNLDLMHLSSYKPDVQGITEMCRELKLLAKRQDVIMITSSLSNFSRENRGLARLYGAKVGKSANMDVVIMIDDVKFSEYDMTLAKRRGKKTSEENAHKVIECNWDNMTTSEVL